MFKKIALFLLIIAVCGVALAADSSAAAGKITTVGDGKITVTLGGAKPAWVKKNTPVKFAEGNGKILDVTPDGVSPVVLTVKTKKASQLKAGHAISFQKGKAMAGC